MNNNNISAHNAPAIVANQSDLAEGLYVLELEERLEMATVATAAALSDRCDVENAS